MKDRELIHIYIKPELKENLKKEADNKGMSLNSYLNLIIYDRQK